MIIEHWCSMQIYSWKLTFNIVKWIYDSWKKFIVYPLVDVTFTVRFSPAIFSIKVFENDSMSTRLRCQTSEEIEEVLEDSAGHFFLTRVASLSCEKWWRFNQHEVSFTSQNNRKIRLLPKPVGKIAITSWPEIRASNASLWTDFRVSNSRKNDKHSCGASAIINLSMVSIVDSLLSTLHASAKLIFVLWDQRIYQAVSSSRAAALVSCLSTHC